MYISPIGGGEGGIRTHDPAINKIPLFESGAFSHSATSPLKILRKKETYLYRLKLFVNNEKTVFYALAFTKIQIV